MQRKFKKEGLLSLFPRSEVQGGGTEMITIEIGYIPEEEVVVEAWTGMIVTGIAEGTEIIVAEVGVAVTLLKSIEVGDEMAMMMTEAIEADQLIVPLQDEVAVHVEVFHQGGVLHLVVHLVQGVIVQRSAALMNVHQSLAVQHLLRLFLLIMALLRKNQLRHEPAENWSSDLLQMNSSRGHLMM